MMSRKQSKITRKEFIQRTSRALVGAGIIARQHTQQLLNQTSLEKCILGNTGINMTKLGFGASRTQESSLLRYAIAKGITFIDTGRGYANGKNEEMVGSVIKGKRSEMIIQSKVRLGPGENSNASTSARNTLRDMFRKSLHESLIALQTDYIDILLFHGAEEEEILFHDAVLESFNKAKEEGKIRAAGFSTHHNQAMLVRKAIEIPAYDVIMTAFNHSGGYIHSMSSRQDSWDQEQLTLQLKTAAGKGIGIIAMKTCSGGPYAHGKNTEPSLPGAVKWVLQQEYIHATAVAMANFTEVDQHVSILVN
jgi:aryl-alcohol dehydrogenase-like predicted oxidoreductase